MTTSADIRRQLVDALRLDLVGPTVDDTTHAEEILDTAPSRFYLTGFLIPYDSNIEDRADIDVADELEEAAGETEEQDTNRVSTRRGFFPSSMGMTVLVPQGVTQVAVDIHWADYKRLDEEPNPQMGAFGRWQRQTHQQRLAVNVKEKEVQRVPGSEGLEIVTTMRAITDKRGLMQPASALSVYLVNRRPPQERGLRDQAYAFQVQLSLDCLLPLVARPNPRGRFVEDPDEKTADLQYRNTVQYGVGHNVSVHDHVVDGRCMRVTTQWLPQAHVLKVDHVQQQAMKADMAHLGQADAAEIQAGLQPLIDAYHAFLTEQETALAGIEDDKRRQHGRKMMHNTRGMQARMADGLAVLQDPQALKAFQIANRVVAAAFLRREAVSREVSPKEIAGWVKNCDIQPAWRPFQIGFILMNLRGLFDPNHQEREKVDLLFFPTGGGKTEAYLGLAAFTLVLRRLRNEGSQAGGLTVLMRYTLRLLTLDQMDRAAALICALEMERRSGPDKALLGEMPFEIGLWVGQGATPNRLGESGDRNQYSARTRVKDYKRDDKRYESPIPLQACPWCGRPITPKTLKLVPDDNKPTDLRLMCQNLKCDFSQRNQATGLPIITVDEPLYQRLPCFIISTVDKFAALPWLADTGKLFGKVTRYDAKEGYIGHEGSCRGDRLPEKKLFPPDLIIQDELHLISGPLGTMAGLYETAVEALMCDDVDYRPKIVASTATVRRAEKQIQGLFARNAVDIFPPPCLDYTTNFFSQADQQNMDRARLYVGVAAQGRSLKVVLMRAYLTLLAAAQKLWEQHGGAANANNPVEPYMTLLGYFNALRELGGSRRIVEDEITNRLTTYAERKRQGETSGSFANRPKLRVPVELTSRESTGKVAAGKKRLAKPFTQADDGAKKDKVEAVDVALATNMISVGLDITRLGLMVVLGQPKTAAEYIQATSRVGRNDQKPGLVVNLLNIHRPRDRSHFESFSFWHSCFYRSVEATSVTPFSARALDRGLAAVVVALARHLLPEMTPSSGASLIKEHRETLTPRIVALITKRADRHRSQADDADRLKRFLTSKVNHLLQTWQRIAEDHPIDYQKETKRNRPLLSAAGRQGPNELTDNEEYFKIQWSLREVEPKVNLHLSYPKGYGKENR